MTFGSINRSDIEIKPSAQGDFLKSIKKENEKLAEILKSPSGKSDFVKNYHKSKRKTGLIEC